MMRSASILFARFSLALIFLIASIQKIFTWHATETHLFEILSDWGTKLSFSHLGASLMARVIPWTPFVLMAATLLELLGSLFLLLGYKEKLGASLLIAFLVPTTILMHPFWFYDGMMSELEATMFLKNLALLGGLIMVTLHGAQARSSSLSSFSLD